MFCLRDLKASLNAFSNIFSLSNVWNWQKRLKFDISSWYFWQKLKTNVNKIFAKTSRSAIRVPYLYLIWKSIGSVFTFAFTLHEALALALIQIFSLVLTVLAFWTFLYVFEYIFIVFIYRFVFNSSFFNNFCFFFEKFLIHWVFKRLLVFLILITIVLFGKAMPYKLKYI